IVIKILFSFQRSTQAPFTVHIIYYSVRLILSTLLSNKIKKFFQLKATSSLSTDIDINHWSGKVKGFA
ncbi:hypothetical protein DKP74_03805, partial [Fructilactobacillus sanfranciscensis]